MKIEKYTNKMQEVLQESLAQAQAENKQVVEPQLLLWGIVQKGPDLLRAILPPPSLLSDLKEEVATLIGSIPSVYGGREAYLSQDSLATLEKAESLSAEMQDEFVTVEHLLYALTMGGGKVAQLLARYSILQSSVLQYIQSTRKGKKADSPFSEDTYNSLSKYAVDLCVKAREGSLDPVIGRDDEIRRVLQILSRRTKNNPILVGDPGVGKTAVVEGLAHRIVRGDVPENLKNKKIFSLDMGALIAGAKYKGEFEERLKSLVEEVQHSDGEILLFVDEIHTLVGAGRSEGAMDAGNIMKPALARGELHVIGATTLDEYRKYFEKDKALERRFQIVSIEEPDEASTVSILRGLKEKYENHHKVRIKDDAILAAVRYSTRYITDRFLPDKAIDLIDEAAARLRIQIDSMPEELDEIVRHMKQLEIEREAIQREDDQEKLDQIRKEIDELKEKENGLRDQWLSEKKQIEQIQQKKEEKEHLMFEADQAEREGNYGKVAEIRYGKVRNIENEITQIAQNLEELRSHSSLIKEEVEVEDIADVVSKWTGIPVSKMLSGQRERLIHLEEELHQRVVGQEEAIQAVADAVRRSRASLQDPNRPIGSFLFLGTTGVGKTELAKALAEVLFDDENMITRIDMSEYQEKFSATRLIGAPPGYVGYEEGGQLTEAVRRKPYSVVLFDEIEKAHPDVFNILLQVLDDGRLTDNQGHVVNFKNTIVIMTSNLGSELIQERLSHSSEEGSLREEQIEGSRDMVLELLKKRIRPEFLNRIDEIVVFTPLSECEIEKIVVYQMNALVKRLTAQGYQITYDRELIHWISENGFSLEFGARPIKRLIQKKLLNALSLAIISGEVSPETPIHIQIQEGEIMFLKS